VLRRYHTLIAALAIALQVIDGVVGALGHSHGDEDVACVTPTHDHGSACSHQHGHDALATDDAHRTPAESAPGQDHDDCSLCRHFSQPVAHIALTIEIVGSQRIEIVVPALVERVFSVGPAAHPARGPPALSV
jgi:hypothetical protein